MIKYDIIGRDKVLARYLGAGPRVRQAVNREVIELTEELAVKVKEKISTYSRSGRLMESVRTFIDYFTPATIQGRVFLDLAIAPYADIQERGGVTRPHAIPLIGGGKILRFLGSEGDIVFRHDVWHPGSRIPAKRFMRDTFQENRAEIIARLRGAARGAM